MYTIKINGVQHTVSYVDGKKVYDPPVDERLEKKWNKNVKEMCKSGVAPGIMGDDTGFHRGRGTLLDQMEGDEEYTKILVDAARKQGYNPGPNDVYVGQLADKKGEPDAWLKPGEGRKELAKRARKKGKGLSMPGLEIEAAPLIKKKQPPLNPKIVNNLKKAYKRSGEASGMTDKELTKHVVEKHGYHRDA